MPPFRHRGATAALRRKAALAELTDLELVSARFGGGTRLFVPWISLVVDHESTTTVHAVFRPGFEGDDAATELPDLCWRRGLWDRGRDRVDAVLEAVPRVPTVLQFVRRSTVPGLTALVDETVATFADGVTVGAARRPEHPWRRVVLEVADERLPLVVDYVPASAQAPTVESWAQRWAARLDALGLEDGIRPDGEVTLGFRRSLHDLLAPPTSER